MMAEGHGFPFDLDGASFQELIMAVMPYLVSTLDTLDEGPAASLDAAEGECLARAVRGLPVSTGMGIEQALEEFFGTALSQNYNTASGRYLAYIPGGGLPSAGVADLIAAIINRYVTVWVAAPGLVQLEQNTLDWMASLIGYDAGSGGLLTSGGSMANFSAIVTAREERLDGPLETGVIYVSEQVHHSVQKAAKLAGIRPENVVSIPCNAEMQMCPDTLTEYIERDRGMGLRPFAIVGSAGTTNTGAIDDLEALAAIAIHYGVWFHVDAAYGGFFLLCEDVKRHFDGIEKADSVTLDPHKGMFLPYGTGALVVRSRAALKRAHDVGADYLPDMGGSPLRIDFSSHGPELSRSFRGLRVWLPLQLHGVDAFRAALSDKLRLAQRAASRMATWKDVRQVPGSKLSVLAFRFVRAGMDDTTLDDINRRWIDGVNARQRTHLSGTRVDGAYTLRMAILSFRTTTAHVDAALDDLEEVLYALQTTL